MQQVLLVEDEALISEMIQDALQDRGLCVKSADSERGAYDLLADETRAFEVLIADINLGPGGNGFDVARRARELHPRMKVVYITGHAAHLKTQGVAGSIMFPKPFYPDDLADQVTALLNRDDPV
jgi:DNA-binding response OmpR family regulator